MTPRTVVITGIGAVTPLGLTIKDTWGELLKGVSGVGPITRFDVAEFLTRIAAEVKGFKATDWMPLREAKLFEPYSHYCIAATQMALDNAGLARFTGEESERVGVFVGSGIGGIGTIEETHSSLLKKGPRRGVSPYFLTRGLASMAAGGISIRFNCRGPNIAHVSACATGAHSIGEAFRAIQYGHADVMICGGGEAPIVPLAAGGFGVIRALSTRNDDPEAASRPFDKGRDGFVIGEGAGILILESLEHAKARGAHIYCEMAGYGLSSDAHHITAPGEDGEGGQRSMRMAIRDARLAPEDIGYINAHGTSTPVGDVLETIAVKKVFGDHAQSLSVSSTKSMIGHLLGGAGGVEAAISVMALADGVMPPTINLDEPDPDCDLDYVANQARERPLTAVLSNSFGFGGTNATLIFKKMP